MPLETATYITDLNITYPAGTDAKSQGDDHIKLLKSVLKNQFNALGAAPVTATAAQLNSIPTLAKTQTMIDISDPAGVVAWLCQEPNSVSKLLLDGDKYLYVYPTVLAIGWHTLVVTQMSPAKAITLDPILKPFGVGAAFPPDFGTAAGHKTVLSGFYDGVDFLLGSSPKHY